MIQIDLSRPDAKIDKLPKGLLGVTPQIILGGPELTFAPSLIRIDRNPTRKSKVSDVRADKPVKIRRAGEYEARSYLGKWGTSLVLDFILSKENDGWDRLELEILKVNFPITFVVFETPIIVTPGTPVRWSFSGLTTNNPLFNGVAQHGQLTRFDRINALLEDD